MNRDQVEGKWTQYKGKAKEKWGKLTDDDLNIIRGKRDQLIGRVQEHYGIMREEAEKQVDAFVNALPPDPDQDRVARDNADVRKVRGAGRG